MQAFADATVLLIFSYHLYIFPNALVTVNMVRSARPKELLKN